MPLIRHVAIIRSRFCGATGCRPFFPRAAPPRTNLPGNGRPLSSRRAIAGRGPRPYATDAATYLVEFVHPVIVGKRALPALDVSPHREAFEVLADRTTSRGLRPTRWRPGDLRCIARPSTPQGRVHRCLCRGSPNFLADNHGGDVAADYAVLAPADDEHIRRGVSSGEAAPGDGERALAACSARWREDRRVTRQPLEPDRHVVRSDDASTMPRVPRSRRVRATPVCRRSRDARIRPRHAARRWRMRPRPNASRRPPRRKRSRHLRATHVASRGASRAKNSAERVARGSRSTHATRLERASACVSMTQQIRGRGSPTSMSTTRVAAVAGDASTVPRRLAPHLADHSPPLAARRRAQRGQRRVRELRRDHRQELPFVGDVQRIETQQFAGAAHLVAHRHVVLVEDDAEPAVARQLVERGGDAAARRIAHPAHAGRRRADQRLDQRQHRPRVGTRSRFEIEFAARQQDRDAVVADRAREQHAIARPRRRADRAQRARSTGRCRSW